MPQLYNTVEILVGSLLLLNGTIWFHPKESFNRIAKCKYNKFLGFWGRTFVKMIFVLNIFLKLQFIMSMNV
jgi:hypothetical protein